MTAPLPPLPIRVETTPPAALFPNRAGKKLHRAAAVAWLRQAGKLAAIQAAGRLRWVNGGPIFTGPVDVRVHVAWGREYGVRQRRSPDVEALGLACKPILDGFSDALIWEDDRQVREICYRQSVDPDGAGYVEIEVREVPNG